MVKERSLFSESWHRVAQQRIRLRPSVSVHKQYFRGELWYVAHDIYGDQYFRFRPEAWDFIARLDGTKTVEAIWEDRVGQNNNKAPGQDEVIQMLSQLYTGNLIISDVPADVVQLFERFKKRKAREWKARIFGIFFLRLSLIDPDNFLNRTLPVVRPFLSVVGALLWLTVFVYSMIVVFSNWDQISSQSAGVFDPSNLPLLYLSFAFAKLLHEMGHAYAVKCFGGEVHRMGLTLLVFTPVPFVDATAAWAFRERWKRVWVGSAGMISELFLAGLAVFVWMNTGPGLVNGIAYNLMIVASVSTLLFNLNPLLRFDGYYILSDMTDSPNLQPRSVQQWYYWIERYAFGSKLARSPSTSLSDSIWLGLFGISSWVYRIFITFTIILFVADKFFGLGFLAAVLTIIGFIIVPLYKGISYLLTGPRIEQVRTRAWLVTGGFLAALVVLLGIIPFPNHFRAPGVVKLGNSKYLITESAGTVTHLPANSRSIKAGQLLLQMENPELELEILNLRAELAHIEAMLRKSMTYAPVDIAPLVEQRRSVLVKLQDLEKRQAALSMKAPVDGRLILFGEHQFDDRWLSRGTVIGELLSGDVWEFLAVVSQEDASKLFDEGTTGLEIRFRGSSSRVFTPERVLLVPGEQSFLPSAALGWPAGGSVRIDESDSSGLRAYEPYFLVVGYLPKDTEGLWHGRTGVGRFDVPAEPLLFQGIQRLRQLLQRRFQL